MTIIRFLRKHNVLIVVLFAFAALVAVLKLQGQSEFQFLTLLSLIGLYLIWALINHFFDKSLKLEIVLEYFLTALLAAIIAYGLLF